MEFIDYVNMADCTVVPVNNKGVMGAGLAKLLRPMITPLDFKYYQRLCNDGAKGGDAYYSWTECWIFAFTKEAWWEGTHKIWVESILQQLILLSSREKSLVLCKLGCGLGGLSWEKEVKPLYDHYLPLMSWKEVYIP